MPHPRAHDLNHESLPGFCRSTPGGGSVRSARPYSRGWTVTRQDVDRVACSRVAVLALSAGNDQTSRRDLTACAELSVFGRRRPPAARPALPSPCQSIKGSGPAGLSRLVTIREQRPGSQLNASP